MAHWLSYQARRPDCGIFKNSKKKKKKKKKRKKKQTNGKVIERNNKTLSKQLQCLFDVIVKVTKNGNLFGHLSDLSVADQV